MGEERKPSSIMDVGQEETRTLARRSKKRKRKVETGRKILQGKARGRTKGKRRRGVEGRKTNNKLEKKEKERMTKDGKTTRRKENQETEEKEKKGTATKSMVKLTHTVLTMTDRGSVHGQERKLATEMLTTSM